MGSKHPGTGDGLAYDSSLHMRWRVAGEGDSIADIHAENTFTLQLLKTADDHAAERRDDKPWASELARIEAKLDLVLQFLFQLQRRQQTLPPEVPVYLYAGGIEWSVEQAPATGTRLLLELYFHSPGFPPLKLFAQVQGVTEIEELTRVHAHFVELEEPLRDWLERFIFQNHRKAIAESHRSH